ncbi:MAG: sugar-transfer associated ATP-grasp domain-containing protein [Pacificimonas sp.]
MLKGAFDILAAMGMRGDGVSRKGHLRQLRDMFLLQRMRRIGPRYYLIAGLNRTTVHDDEMLGHVNETEYEAFLEHINPVERIRPLYSKAEQKRRLVGADIPTPQPVFTTEAGEGDTGAAFAEAVRQSGLDRLVVKPLRGFAGRGFQVYTVDRSGADAMLVGDDGQASTAADLPVRFPDGFVAEAFIDQHPWYASLNPESVNTWRIWAISDRRDVPEILIAMLRMGRTGSRVDNIGGGGCYAVLGPDDRLGPVGDATIRRRMSPGHPDSRIRVEGVAPPFAEEAKALAARALAAMPELRFAGVDIAVERNGPTVTEVNAEPDRMGAARTDWPFGDWLRAQRYLEP